MADVIAEIKDSNVRMRVETTARKADTVPALQAEIKKLKAENEMLKKQLEAATAAV